MALSETSQARSSSRSRRPLEVLRRTPTFSSVLRRGVASLLPRDADFRYSLSRLPEHPEQQPPLTVQDTGVPGVDEWGRLQAAVCGLVYAQNLAPGQLTSLHDDIRVLQRSKAGPFIREYLESRILSAACETMVNNIRGAPRLEPALADTWNHFFAHLLPTVEAIFIAVQGQRLTVRQTTLIAFRDHVVLPLEEALVALLEEVGPTHTPASLKHMLLVLQSVTEEYPPSPRRLRLEALVARGVTPYLGYRGLYESGGPDPDLESGELQTAHQRRPSVINDASVRRLLLRPLSVSGSGQRADTLAELFAQSAGRHRLHRTFSLRQGSRSPS